MSAVTSSSSRSSFSPRDAALLGVLALLWGNSFLLIKIAVADIAPVWIVGGRLTIGGALLTGIVLARGQRFSTDRRLLLALFFVGTAGAGLPWLGQAWAQQYLDSGLSAVLNAATPVATLVLAVAIGQERLTREKVIGLSVAVVGTLIVIGGEVRAGGPVLALVTATLATVGYGTGAVVTKAAISGKQGPFANAASQLVLAAVLLNGMGLVMEGLPPAPWSIDPVAAGALGALGLLGTGTAFVIFFVLIERVGATNASMVTYLVPIVGLVSGALARGERFGPSVFVGAAVLICGVWIAQRTREPSPTPVPSEPAAVG